MPLPSARRAKRSSCWCWAQRLSNACRRPPLAGLVYKAPSGINRRDESVQRAPWLQRVVNKPHTEHVLSCRRLRGGLEGERVVGRGLRGEQCGSEDGDNAERRADVPGSSSGLGEAEGEEGEQ
eukprot:scaffold28876_cov72-Phaeocystis_antarctica.AAC.7